MGLIFSQTPDRVRFGELACQTLIIVFQTRTLPSSEATQLLVATASDNNGRLIKVRTMSGLTVQAGGKDFAEGGDPRTEALWEAAVFELCDKALLKEEGYKGEVYSVTHLGYQVADQLSK